MQKSASKKYELNDMTQKCLLRLKHQLYIWILKQNSEECIIVSIDILSANIADNIIDADIYHEAFAYFVDELEIIMEMLDNEAGSTKEVCVDFEEEEKKWKKLKIVQKEATRICIQGQK